MMGRSRTLLWGRRLCGLLAASALFFGLHSPVPSVAGAASHFLRIHFDLSDDQPGEPGGEGAPGEFHIDRDSLAASIAEALQTGTQQTILIQSVEWIFPEEQAGQKLIASFAGGLPAGFVFQVQLGQGAVVPLGDAPVDIATLSAGSSTLRLFLAVDPGVAGEGGLEFGEEGFAIVFTLVDTF